MKWRKFHGKLEKNNNVKSGLIKMTHDDQVWNAFITSLPKQDQARHDLEHFQARLLKNALQEIEDLTLEITQHTAEIQQLQDVLQGYSSLLHDVTADRDRFREDWQAMVRELSRWRPQTKGNE